MSATAFRTAFEQLPEPLRIARSDAWQRFEAYGLPTRRNEDWHYTDLSGLATQRFAGTGSLPRLAAALPGFEAVRFVDGYRLDAPPAAAQTAALIDDGITAMNAALATDGLDLDLRQSPERPLQIIVWAGAAPMSHLRHRIRLARGVEATILLDIRSADAETLSTQVAEIEVGAGARLRLIRIQDCGAHGVELSRTEVTVRRDAAFEYVGLDLGGRLARHDLNVRLSEPGAQTELSGVYAPAGRTHADTHTRILHLAPHCRSRELFRGLVMDEARAIFNGKIVVARNAQKTDSEQHVASLLLSPKAEVDAKPELEIYADDVKCAHGATCGQLDGSAIYYLRSRGLDLATARNLLMFTFAREALSKAPGETLQRELQQRLLARLPGSGGLEELL
jgi:Fe-S cluster assembly protein SufD